MEEQTGENVFRIPKISVPITCHTLFEETIPGEIFLNMTGSGGYSSSNLLDFFNDDSPFFPFRLASGKRPVLLRKRTLVQIEVPGLLERYEQEPATLLSQKVEAVLHLVRVGAVRATIILDQPQEYARVLDLLNLDITFYPVIINGVYTLINSHHLYKVEEL